MEWMWAGVGVGGCFGCLFIEALGKRCLMGSATPCIALIDVTILMLLDQDCFLYTV